MLNTTVGVILAGGNSTRMGRDKALLPFKGKPLIQVIAETLQGSFSNVFIVSDRSLDYHFLRLPLISDLYKDCGPMGGIHAALTQLQTGDIFVLGCDTPFVSKELISYIARYPGTRLARVAQADGWVHPLCGVYARTALPIIIESIRAGRLKMIDLLKELHTTYIPITPDLPFYRKEILLNLNNHSSLKNLL